MSFTIVAAVALILLVVYVFFMRRSIMRYVQLTGGNAPRLITRMVLGTIFGVPLYFTFRNLDRKEAREQEQRISQHQEADRTRRTEDRSRLLSQWEADEAGKARARREWLASNPLTIYYHTVSGVTAALTPAALEQARRRTQAARTNEYWEHQTLKPSPDTLIFISKTGERVIEPHLSRYGRPHMYDGMLSQLHEVGSLCKELVLVHDPTIFVPWTGVSILSFDEQLLALCRTTRDRRDVTNDLVESQVPLELHPTTFEDWKKLQEQPV